MANPLFALVSPSDLADGRELIEFKGEVGEFGRLSEIVAADLAALSASSRPADWRAAPVEIRLQFDWADGRTGSPLVSGRARTCVAAVCQRCLEDFVLDLDVPIDLLLAQQEEEWMGRPEFDHFELWEMAGDTLRPLDLVEECLVMALPFAPMHAASDTCSTAVVALQDDDKKTVRPFADLRSQLEKRH